MPAGMKGLKMIMTINEMYACILALAAISFAAGWIVCRFAVKKNHEYIIKNYFKHLVLDMAIEKEAERKSANDAKGK